MEHPLQHWKSFLILLCLFVPSTANSQPAETVDRVVAEVGDQVITLTDLRWQIGLHNYPQPTTEAAFHHLYRDVLDQLINQILIARDIAKTPFVQVTDSQLDQFFGDYVKRFGSREDLEQRLQELGMTESDLRRILRRELAVNKFIDLRFEPFVIILPDDIEEYYRTEYVPKLEKQGSPVPDLSVVRETIRQILSVRRTNSQLEDWVQNARSRAQIRETLFPQPVDMPNLPRQFDKEIHTVEDPFSKNPSSNRQ